MSDMLEFCRKPEMRCEECPISSIERSAPAVAEHILAMIGLYGINYVSSEARKAENAYDAMGFGRLVEISGKAIQAYNDDFSGFDIASKAVRQIAQQHPNIF